MTSKIDQKSYLQKYLSGSSNDKKKKKKKVTKGKGFKIIDDDIDLSKLRPLDEDELDILDQGEDGPQIAGIIDERPEEVKKLEQFKTSSKWRVVNQDDGFSSKLQIEEIKKNVEEAQKENELVFGKMYSDSEDEKQNDSDLSPPRIRPNERANDRKPEQKNENKSDSDYSPPRKGRESSRSDSKNDTYISQNSKTVKSKRDRSRKSSRWGDPDPVESSAQIRSNSPSPKRSKHRQSPGKRKKSKSPGSDLSPPRKSEKDKFSSQFSRKGHNQRNRSPGYDDYSQKNRKPSEQSYSKDRHHSYSSSGRNNHRNNENVKKQINSDDSDLSPPRKHKRKSEPSKQLKKKYTERHDKQNRDSSSDLSPPRRKRNAHDDNRNYTRSDNSPPPTNKKMEKTLDGKKAGLQDARQLREENEAFRKIEDEAFNKMADEVSGRNAQAVSRKVSKRETSEERRKQKEKAERQKELDEKYKKWSKGLKQIEAQEARMQDFRHEASKPLARHRDDRDLENSLKDVIRDGDPMLQYIMDKKRERGELGPEKPMYKGNFPPNRFNIRPGYRWDGVDRSNGYEKKFFEHQSKRKAQEEEAYKWSTEDL